MSENIYNNPECCTGACKCPICLETKPLMELNCHHYVCEQDILEIINSNNRTCPICRTLITSYGCNGNYNNVIPPHPFAAPNPNIWNGLPVAPHVNNNEPEPENLPEGNFPHWFPPEEGGGLRKTKTRKTKTRKIRTRKIRTRKTKTRKIRTRRRTIKKRKGKTHRRTIRR
jgi:hypothetical protein